MIAAGLAIELIAAALLLVGLTVGGAYASAILWAAVAVVLLGLAVATVGVARARPPIRVLTTAGQTARPFDPPQS